MRTGTKTTRAARDVAVVGPRDEAARSLNRTYLSSKAGARRGWGRGVDAVRGGSRGGAVEKSRDARDRRVGQSVPDFRGDGER